MSVRSDSTVKSYHPASGIRCDKQGAIQRKGKRVYPFTKAVAVAVLDVLPKILFRHL